MLTFASQPSYRCIWPGVQDGLRPSHTQPSQADAQLWPTTQCWGDGVPQDLWRAILVSQPHVSVSVPNTYNTSIPRLQGPHQCSLLNGWRWLWDTTALRQHPMYSSPNLDRVASSMKNGYAPPESCGVPAYRPVIHAAWKQYLAPTGDFQKTPYQTTAHTRRACAQNDAQEIRGGEKQDSVEALVTNS